MSWYSQEASCFSDCSIREAGSTKDRIARQHIKVSLSQGSKVSIFSSWKIGHYYSQHEDVIIEYSIEPTDDVIKPQLLSSHQICSSTFLRFIVITITTAKSSLSAAIEWSTTEPPKQEQVYQPRPMEHELDPLLWSSFFTELPLYSTRGS